MIGIVILNYNSWNEVQSCLQSIQEVMEYRCYIVDNASTEAIPESITQMERDKQIILIRNTVNSGYAAGNNVGIKRALKDGCQFIVVCNSDICFFEGSLYKMWRFLENHKEVGIVGPKIIDRQGKTQKSCMCKKTGIKEKYLIRTKLFKVFRKLNIEYWGLNQDYENGNFEVYAVLGCCFMITADCARKVTPFDEETFLYEEELILGIKMENNRQKTWYCSESVVLHEHGKSTEKLKAFSFACNVESEIYYCKNYLKMRIWEIFPLYLYRMICYLGRGFGDKNYFIEYPAFLKRTGRRLMEKSGHGSK